MSNAGFDYDVLEGNIHRFVMYHIDRKTIDAFLEVFRDTLETVQEGDPHLTILDYSHSGMPPINYSFQRIEKIHKDRGFRPTSRSLIIFTDSLLFRVTEALLRPWNFLSLKFAQPGEEAQYMNWLKTGQM